MFRNLALASLLLMVAACSQPARDLPVAQAGLMTPAQQVSDVRAIVEPCERAMDRASGDIGLLASAVQPGVEARNAVSATKSACLNAFGRLQKAHAPGPVRDACLSAVYTRETLADTAIAMLNGQAGALAVTTLKYKSDDQSAADQACTLAIASSGAREFAMAPNPSQR